MAVKRGAELIENCLSIKFSDFRNQTFKGAVHHFCGAEEEGMKISWLFNLIIF